MLDENGIVGVVGFCQIVLERGAAGAMTEDPAGLPFVGIAECVDGVTDDGLSAGP